MPNLKCQDGLWFLDNHLIIPNAGQLQKTLFRLAHDNLGHFGFDKSYKALHHSYFWPRMHKELETAYIPSCIKCQRNKSTTTKPLGPLHLLPVPNSCCDSVAIDFIRPLLPDDGFDCIATFTDCLGSDVQLLHKLTGVQLKLSTAYHPQTDGTSERTNKTMNQCIRFHVERNQKGWAKLLPLIQFNIMNTVNKSTSFSPFQLWLGHVPHILPPLTSTTGLTETSDLSAIEVIRKMHTDTLEAKDDLNWAKISQAIQSNKTQTLTFLFKIGDHVQLSTLHRRHKFKGSGECHIAKFMPRFNGPFKIIGTNKTMSTVKLELPPNSKTHPVFHTSLVLPFKENDPNLFPRRKFAKPQLIINKTSDQEDFVKDIIDEHQSGHRFKFFGTIGRLWRRKPMAHKKGTWRHRSARHLAGTRNVGTHVI